MTAYLPTVGRSFLLGLVSGARSFSGVAAQVAATPSLATRQPERTLGRRPVKGVLALLAVGELVGDKLPTAPSRLAPVALVPRLGLAAVAALLVARAEDERTRPGPTAYEEGPAEGSLPPEGPLPAVPAAALAAVPVAVGASLAAAFLGHAWRGWTSKAFGRDLPGALLEDAATLALAGVAAVR